MAEGGWFLEKKGKYYGPFSAEKVRGFKAAGKIVDRTQIATGKDGRDARPLSEMIDQLNEEESKPSSDQGNGVVSKAPRRSPGETQENDDPKEWLVVTDKREFGPYRLSHLADLAREGKLKATDTVRQKNGTQQLSVSEILPSTPAPNSARSESKSTEPQPIRRKQAPVEDQPPKKFRWMPALLVFLLLGAGLFGFLYMRGIINIGKGDLREKINKIKDESLSLQKMARRSEIPPFNTMVQKALKVGLNFPGVDIRNYHTQDIDNRGTKRKELKYRVSESHWQQFFKTPIRRVLSYTINGQVSYTYLLGDDGLAFAVVIEGPTFGRQKIDDYQLDNFAPRTQTIESVAGRTVWASQIAEGILARAYWKMNKKAKNLEFICIMNDPDLEGGG